MRKINKSVDTFGKWDGKVEEFLWLLCENVRLERFEKNEKKMKSVFYKEETWEKIDGSVLNRYKDYVITFLPWTHVITASAIR